MPKLVKSLPPFIDLKPKPKVPLSGSARLLWTIIGNAPLDFQGGHTADLLFILLASPANKDLCNSPLDQTV